MTVGSSLVLFAFWYFVVGVVWSFDYVGRWI